jgi:hypothetical protein
VQAQKRPRVAPFRIALLFALCCGLAQAALAGGEAAVRSEEAVRSGQKLAAVMAVKKTVADLAQVRIGGLERVWAQQILRDLPRHVQATESRQILAADYEVRLRGVLAERLRRIHTSFHSLGQKDRWFTEAWLTDQVKTRMRDPVEQSLSRNAELHLAEIFGAARQTAVREQSANLAKAAYPTVEEVEILIQAGWSPDAQERIGRTLVQRMARGRLLLEETERQLEESATAAVAEARAQFQSQADALEQPVPEQARAAEDIARALAEHVEDARLQRKMAGGHPVYGPFPTILRRLKDRAKDLEKERFQAFCQRFSPAVSAERMRSLIQSGLSRHRSPETSRKIFTEALLPEAASEAVRLYTRSVADPRKAAALRARLQGLALHDEEVRGTLAASLSTALDAPLGTARSSIAQAQLEAHFPKVASSRWSAPESVLLQIVQGELGISTFKDSLALPLLNSGGLPYQPSALLMETEDRVLSGTSKLLAEGKTAWDEQAKVVRHFEKEIPKAIRGSKEDRSAVEWEKHFVEKAETRWREKRSWIWRGANPIPPSAAGKYVGLFQYMREQIRKHVKNEFEIAKQPQTPTLSTRAPEAKIAGPAPRPSPISGGGPGGGGEGAGRGGSQGAQADGSGEGGSGDGSVVGCLWFLLRLLLGCLFVTSIAAFIRWILQSLKANLDEKRWVPILLGVLILFIGLFAWLLFSPITVEVADVPTASADLARVLGVQPETKEDGSTVFRLGFLRRLELRK